MRVTRSKKFKHESGERGHSCSKAVVSVWENIEMALRAGQDLCWPALGRLLVWGISGDSHIWFQNGVE